MSPLEISLRRTDDNRHPPWKSEHVIGSTMWQRRVQRSCVTLAVALLASVAGCSTSDGVPPPVPSDAGLLTFPRTATYFLFQHDLPTAQELAQYDVVVIDNEWGHRMPRDFFDDVRAANPRTRLLAYVNLIDHPDRLGSEEYWRNRYRLWQFDSHGESQFPDEWLAKRADGTVVSEWPDTSMSNLTDQGPRVDGLSFGRYAADWVVDTVWSQGVWDGIFLDVWGDRIYSADSDRWDIDRNGTDEADAQIYGEDMPWGRGIEEAERIMRDRMPTALLVANGDRTLRDRQLDGRAWENFADPRAERDPRFDIEQYIRLTARGDHREPGLAMTINKLGPQPRLRTRTHPCTVLPDSHTSAGRLLGAHGIRLRRTRIHRRDGRRWARQRIPRRPDSPESDARTCRGAVFRNCRNRDGCTECLPPRLRPRHRARQQQRRAGDRSAGRDVPAPDRHRRPGNQRRKHYGSCDDTFVQRCGPVAQQPMTHPATCGSATSSRNNAP